MIGTSRSVVVEFRTERTDSVPGVMIADIGRSLEKFRYVMERKIVQTTYQAKAAMTAPSLQLHRNLGSSREKILEVAVKVLSIVAILSDFCRKSDHMCCVYADPTAAIRQALALKANAVP
jgi:hypothetical protein